MLRDDWTKEVKRMNDAIINLKKAKVLYFQRSMDHEKAKVKFNYNYNYQIKRCGFI